MKNTVENSQIDEFIANLKGRKAYEQKKAIKLGFANFEDYIADKISNQFSDTPNVCKAPKQRVRRKNNTKQSRLLLVVAVDKSQMLVVIKLNRQTQLNLFKVLLQTNG